MFSLPPGDSYDRQCGEVFLTLNGNIIFHCTMCEMKYRGISEYAVHVIDKHFDPAIPDDCMSTHSFDDLEDDSNDIKIECENDVNEISDEDLYEQVEALREDAITYSGSKESIMGAPVLTAVSVAAESDTELKWEEISFEEEESYKPPPKKKKSPAKVRPPSLPTPKQATSKPLTDAERIRMANEAAKDLEVSTFKKPMQRGNFPDSERKHKCNFCGFAFKDSSNLIAHIKRHSDKRNFQCAYCSKMFCTRTEIEEHSRRHRKEKPYVCDYENCDKAYFSRSELNIHQKRIHLNQKNVSCEFCGRGFFDKSDLKEHMVSHSKERKHICSVCNGKFSRRKALVNHMKLHENKREYQCELCPARFNQKPGLFSHMKNKHKDQ